MRYSRVIHTCLFCGKPFPVKKSHSERGKGVYCSHACKGAHKTRQTQEAHERHFGMPIYDILYELHHNREMTIAAVAKELQTSTRTIYNWIADLDFPTRSRHEAIALQWKDNEQRRHNARTRLRAILQRLNIRGAANPAKRPDVREKIRLSKIGPKNAMYGKGGAANAAWRGGKIDYRGGDWKRQRKAALERDNYQCQHCGKRNCVLEVHHKTPFRVSHDNQLSNLVTVCQQCHHILEDEWERTHPIEQRRLRIF